MCYSSESSIKSFTIGISTSLYLLFFSKNPTNRHIGLFFAFVSIIQLLEYFMWIDQKCGLLNNFASRSVVLVLALQVYSLFLGGYIFNTTYIPSNYLFYALLLGSFSIMHTIYFYYFQNNLKWCTKPNENNSMQWANFGIVNKRSTYLYYGIFIAFALLLKEHAKGLVVLLLGLFTFTYTRYSNVNTSNSRWCFFSAFIPSIMIAIEKMQHIR